MVLNNNFQKQINIINARLSLRSPQLQSLKILADIIETINLSKKINLEDSVDKIKSKYKGFTSYERNFVSLCFAIATGVGKTRLMAAFISFLYTQLNIRNFFILAPNLTIYEKLINDFRPNSKTYVLNGLSEFSNTPPRIITGDNYDKKITDTRSLSLIEIEEEATINIFNIGKINSEVRSGRSPKIKTLHEYIGESYFDFLANLNDLVLIMDESHRYRGDAGFSALNDLKPLIGLELTATPQTIKGNNVKRFENIVYNYPLANALKDGFVKEPAVAGREDFVSKNYEANELEELKIKDGIHIHEQTKIELNTFCNNNNLKKIKPFVLIIAQDTSHANKILSLIKSDEFYNGAYKEKVITVHSNQKGEESDENIKKLLSVEDYNEPTEIIIHVEKLKEGWDVKNLYTIIPLRAANSITLIEQSIGRGLRLPFGKRVGVKALDRLTIVAHDKFNEIIQEASNPNSIIKNTIIIGKDIDLEPRKMLTISNSFISSLVGSEDSKEKNASNLISPEPTYKTDSEKNVIKLLVDILKQKEKNTVEVPNLNSLITDQNKNKIIQEVNKAYDDIILIQNELTELLPKPNINKIVEESLNKFIQSQIGIPRIYFKPKGDVKSGFNDFDLDTNSITQRSVSQNILIEYLRSNERQLLTVNDNSSKEEILENYIVKHLIDKQDINYEKHSELLYKLASQVINKIKSYEPNFQNVIKYNQIKYADLIYSQLRKHWWNKLEGEYEVVVSRGFQFFSDVSFSYSANEKIRNISEILNDGEKYKIQKLLFSGFKRCCFAYQKFQSNPEKEFASLLEKDVTNNKWLKPFGAQFQIEYKNSEGENSLYYPDFIVETEEGKFIVETKQSSKMNDEDVKLKAKATNLWCNYATKHELNTNLGKSWSYILIPDTDILPNSTLKYLFKEFKFS